MLDNLNQIWRTSVIELQKGKVRVRERSNRVYLGLYVYHGTSGSEMDETLEMLLTIFSTELFRI